jgi:hypothetical protein
MPRHPRFQRSANVPTLRITERDFQIIRLIYRHSFLRSPQIIALIDGSSRQILKRLQLLYHHGYLERPRAQIDYYHKGGSRHMAYGLASKGSALLGIQSRCSEKIRGIGRMFLEHALFVSEVMVNIKLACRERRIRLITQDELYPKQFRWTVNVNGKKLGIIPDRVFALEFTTQNGVLERAYFFLEADRGTMPVIRKNLAQTSFYRKLVAYESTWSQSIHTTRFGFHRFRVLAVTKSQARVKSLVDACSQLKSGRGLFLFADRNILDKPEGILSAMWQTGNQGESASLLD